MVPFKTAGLAMGSLALSQRAAAATPPDVAEKTSDVLQWFNLFRNARIDVQLPNLQPMERSILDKADEFLQLQAGRYAEYRSFSLVREPETCEVQENASTMGLLLEVTPDIGDDYGKLLDQALEKALPTLLDNSESRGSTSEDTTLASISFLASEAPTHVGCGITTRCTTTYLFCKFANIATPAPGDFIVQSSAVVTKAFAEALAARKNANIKIADLKLTDANTPLTSNVSVVALSALAMLAVAIPALIF